MTNKKTLVFAAVIATLTSLFFGAIGYAALTQRLDVQGSAEFVPETWQVNFKAGSLSSPTLNLATVATAPTLSDTIIGDFAVNITQPGSSVTYTFDIENTGTLDAELTSYVLGTPVCTGTTGDSKTADEAIVCSDDLTYTLTYVSGDLASNGVTAGDDIAIGDTLLKDTTVKVQLKLEFSSAATELPLAAVDIEGLDSYLIYSAI